MGFFFNYFQLSLTFGGEAIPDSSEEKSPFGDEISMSVFYHSGYLSTICFYRSFRFRSPPW